MVLRGAKLLIKSSGLPLQLGPNVQSVVFGLSATVCKTLTPDGAFVPLEERRNSCRSFGGSRTDHPS